VIRIGNTRDDMRKESMVRLLRGADNVECNICRDVAIACAKTVYIQHLTE
jgi:LSD1 subclass zinc finger protein